MSYNALQAHLRSFYGLVRKVFNGTLTQTQVILCDSSSGGWEYRQRKTMRTISLNIYPRLSSFAWMCSTSISTKWLPGRNTEGCLAYDEVMWLVVWKYYADSDGFNSIIKHIDTDSDIIIHGWNKRSLMQIFSITQLYDSRQLFIMRVSSIKLWNIL